MFFLTSYSFFEILLIALLGLVINLALGGPARLYAPVAGAHPTRLLHRLVAAMEKRLNKEKRGTTALHVRGLILVMIVLLLCLAVGVAIHEFAQLIPGGVLIEVVVFAIMVAPRGLLDQARAMAQLLALEDNAFLQGIPVAILRRHPQTLDRPAVTRAVIESLAENFCNRVVAPLLWFILTGMPGLLIARAIHEMGGLLDDRSDRFRAFGWAAARFNDIVNYLPARLGALFLVVASFFVPSAHPLSALKLMWRDARKLSSPNSGWPIAAAAGALGLTLAGPRSLHLTYVNDAWVGEGTAQAEVKDLRRAILLYSVSCLLVVMLVAGMMAPMLS